MNILSVITFTQETKTDINTDFIIPPITAGQATGGNVKSEI